MQLEKLDPPFKKKLVSRNYIFDQSKVSLDNAVKTKTMVMIPRESEDYLSDQAQKLFDHRKAK